MGHVLGIGSGGARGEGKGGAGGKDESANNTAPHPLPPHPPRTPTVLTLIADVSTLLYGTEEEVKNLYNSFT